MKLSEDNIRSAAETIATVFGVGYVAFAPGTIGTLFGVLIYLLIKDVPPVILWRKHSEKGIPLL